jgi:hypothetical protein
MTPEEKDLLQRAVELGEENNRLLKKLHRSSVLSLVFRIVYWALILFLSFGAYYFIQPYVNQMLPLLTATSSDVSAIKNIGTMFNK